MAPRTRTAAPQNAKAALKRIADLETENRRLMEQLATGQRAADDKDDKDDRDDDDTASDKNKDDKDSDDERDAQEPDDKESDDDDADAKRDDDADDEMDGDDEDAKRSGKGKRKAMTEAEVRKSAEEAVRKDRVRGAQIREIAAQFGFPKLGERHAAGETSVRAFKDLVLEKLADRQKKRGNTTFAAGPSDEIGDEMRVADNGPTAQGRAFEKGAAEFRQLLGK